MWLFNYFGCMHFSSGWLSMQRQWGSISPGSTATGLALIVFLFSRQLTGQQSEFGEHMGKTQKRFFSAGEAVRVHFSSRRPPSRVRLSVLRGPNKASTVGQTRGTEHKETWTLPQFQNMVYIVLPTRPQETNPVFRQPGQENVPSSTSLSASATSSHDAHN